MENDGLAKTSRLKISIGETEINFRYIENDLAYSVADYINLKEEKDLHRISAAMSFRQKVDFF